MSADIRKVKECRYLSQGLGVSLTRSWRLSLTRSRHLSHKVSASLSHKFLASLSQGLGVAVLPRLRTFFETVKGTDRRKLDSRNVRRTLIVNGNPLDVRSATGVSHATP